MSDRAKAVCPKCRQPIMIGDDGRFVQHNAPGWTRGSKARTDASKIVRPTNCKGSGQTPEAQ